MKSSRVGSPSSPATKLCAKRSKRPSIIEATSPSHSSPAKKSKPTSSIAFTGATLAESWVQYFAPNATDKRKLSYDHIARLEFSGKDRAAGKHWEDWVKAYTEKKAAGEKNIALVPESLE